MIEGRVLVALKIDVDTERGMREGLPRMLAALARRSIRATIFVSMGPDHSGRAIRRIFTKPGFLSKVMKTNAVSLYGPRTLLYGTLLPGPRIAERNRELFLRIAGEGHEPGIHGWDHVRWQDGVPKFDEPTIVRELTRARETFAAITGAPPRATAAPGWIVSARSLAAQDRFGFSYASDARGRTPFLPRIGATRFRTVQIPTTLPTLDEMIGRRELFETVPGSSQASAQAQGEGWINRWLAGEAVRQARSAADSPIVHTVHTEVEGLSRLEMFADLLDRLLAEGAQFTRLDAVAERLGANLPVSDLVEGTLPGRSGTLAVQAS